MKLLIAIMTCHRLDYYIDDLTIDWCTQQNLRCTDQQARVNTIRATWLTSDVFTKVHPDFNIDYRFFYGTVLRDAKRNQRVPDKITLREPLTDEVYLDCRDGYKDNPDKMKAICRWALAHGYDYVLRVDDDTCIFPDRLIVRDRALWDGFDYSGASASNFHPGGCVFLSRRMMELIISEGFTTYADDVWMGEIAMKHRIPMTTVSTMRNHWGDRYKIPVGADIASDASLHSCSPDVIQDLWRRYVASQPQAPSFGEAPNQG